jgi:RND family efflux transporter MFP subunit
MNDDLDRPQAPLEAPQEAAASQPATPAAKPRSAVRWVVALLAVVAVGATVYYGRYVAGRETPVATAAPAPPPLVTVSHPLVKTITEWDEYTGQFQAVDYVAVRARVSGYLTEIHYTDGQWVNKGDLLFVIDPRPFQIDLDSADAQLAQATARLEWAKTELGRVSALRKGDYATASSFDEKLQETRSAAAAVDTANAAIAAAKLNLEFTHVTAPLDGRTGAHQVSIGNLIGGGSNGASDVLTTIVSLKPIYFIFDMSESQYLAYQRAIVEGRLASQRSGTVPAFVKLSDEQDWKHQGWLDFVDNQIDRSSGTIRVRAQFPNSNLFIAPGTFGRLRLPGSDPHPAILIPDSAVVSDQSRKEVLTVAADGTVTAKEIRPGPSYGNLRIVRAGLAPGDTIIIDGLLRAHQGAKVTPEPGQIILDESGN